jgi:hypothetical protein
MHEGVELDRSLLAKWVGHAATLLQPLVETLRRHVMFATKLHADDMPVPGLAPGNGKTKVAPHLTSPQRSTPSVNIPTCRDDCGRVTSSERVERSGSCGRLGVLVGEADRASKKEWKPPKKQIWIDWLTVDTGQGGS